MNATKVSASFLGLLVVIAIAGVLKITGSVIIPLVLSAFLSFILAPAVSFLQKRHIPRFISILIILLIVIGLVYLFGLVLFASFNSFLYEFPKYQARFDSIYRDVDLKLSELFDFNTTDALLDVDWGAVIRDSLFAVSGNFIDFFKSLAMIVIFLIFMLMEHHHLLDKIGKAFPSPMSDRISNIVGHISTQIGKYLALKLAVSLVTGVLVWLSLEIIGVDFALLWGFIALILNFIPNIGSLIVLVVTILMGFVQFYPNYYSITAVAIAMISIQVIIGNIIDPRLQGKRLNLSPLFILISLLLWGWIWGIIGMFLAVPITVIIKITCENIPELRPVSVFIGSGKFLDENQGLISSFYNRIKKIFKKGNVTASSDEEEQESGEE